MGRVKFGRWLVLTSWLVASGSVGCAPGSPSKDPSGTAPGKVAASEESADSDSARGAASELRLELGDLKTLDQRIARHRGQVVVVDFWSTWCGPCVAEFPHLVELQREYGKGVACLSVNCNFAGSAEEPPASFRGEVEQFLREKQAHFEHLISTVADTELFDQMQVASVPVVRVYNVDGRLAKQFVNDNNEYGEEGFRYETHIRPLVDQLLKSTPSQAKSSESP